MLNRVKSVIGDGRNRLRGSLGSLRCQLAVVFGLMGALGWGDQIVFQNGQISPEGRIVRDVEGEPSVTFYLETQGQSIIPRSEIREIRRSSPGTSAAQRESEQDRTLSERAELMRRSHQFAPALELLSQAVAQRPGQAPSAELSDTYLRIVLDLQGTAKQARTEGGRATDSPTMLENLEASRRDYRALYLELVRPQAQVLLGPSFRRIATSVAEELAEVSITLARQMPNTPEGLLRRAELMLEASTAQPANNQLRWQAAEAAVAAQQIPAARTLYEFLVRNPGVEREWADAARSRLQQLDDPQGGVSAPLVPPSTTPVPTATPFRTPTVTGNERPLPRSNPPPPVLQPDNVPENQVATSLEWSDFTRVEKLIQLPGRLFASLGDLGLDQPLFTQIFPLFLIGFYGLPWGIFAILKKRGDPQAYDAARWIFPLGVGAFVPYIKAKISRPKIKHRCPHCSASLDNIENFGSLNFVVCPHCRENISPIYSLSDYIQHLVTMVQMQTSRNMSTLPGSTVVIERDAMSKLLRAVITLAVRQRASDLMVETEVESLKIRARIDGIMYDLQSLPRNVASPFISAIKVATNLDITEKRVPQDGKFTLVVDDQNVDLRVNTSPSPQGERATIRLLTHRTLRLEPAKLGLAGKDLAIFAESIHRPHGLVIVTGPTGSGKSTTLYVALNELNRGDKNIVTIEDPIEYQIKGISQMQVNVAQNFTFASGLRSILRQGPDVIMVGEIRDNETATIAIEAAATGHLVFTTLHTIDSPTAFTRLADLGIETRRMASAIACIIAQRLCRLVCPDCITTYDPPPEVLMKLGLLQAPPMAFIEGAHDSATLIDDVSFGPEAGTSSALNWSQIKDIKYVIGKGCPSCMNTGFHGRIGIFEFLVPNDDLRTAIESGASIGHIRELARKAGMRTLREAGIARIKESLTSPEEILRVTAT